MHTVVMTGYTDTVVYVNDPVDVEPNKKLERESFKAAWDQMGKQAAVVLSEH